MSACAVVYSLTVMGFQYLGAYRGDMPAVSDGPYLTLEELGVEGERHSYFTNGPSGLRYEKGLLSENWYTNEQVYQPQKEDIVWLYPDVYRLRPAADGGFLCGIAHVGQCLEQQPGGLHPPE